MILPGSQLGVYIRSPRDSKISFDNRHSPTHQSILDPVEASRRIHPLKVVNRQSGATVCLVNSK